ncbi:MAG: DUF423 domain-containing protein [Lysobacter sp.]
MNATPLTDPDRPDRPGRFSSPSRTLAASGGVLAAASVALFAYAAHAAHAAHAAEPQVQASLHSAALFAFGHGIALAALAPRARRRLAVAALGGLLLGTLLFSGSLAGARFFGTPTTLAPLGGGLMILAWLLWAADAVRR